MTKQSQRAPSWQNGPDSAARGPTSLKKRPFQPNQINNFWIIYAIFRSEIREGKIC